MRSQGLLSRNHSDAGVAMPSRVGRLIGTSPEIVALQEQIGWVARSDARVLIMGESGVGKEIVAHATHFGGARSSQRFVPVNCAGLPDELLESELFGHVKGSFTGAHRDRPGAFETAHLGTVFLDEVGEMSLRMQGLLLRFLETGELQPVGADAGRHVNVRVIAATNRNLPEMIDRRTFREDLYHRLNVVRISVPPLRGHRSDIPLLVDHFLNRFVSSNHSPVTSLSPAAMRVLQKHAWPGNVRELENLIERLTVTVHKMVVDTQDLPAELTHTGPVSKRRERRRSVADDLYALMRANKQSFWTTVYPRYIARDICRADVRDIVRKGLEESNGNYRSVVRLFNLEAGQYARFLSFLRKHDCQVPFKEYRSSHLN
jgi:transcriptional regulator with GAF, ATPase, and Fis domain